MLEVHELFFEISSFVFNKKLKNYTSLEQHVNDDRIYIFGWTIPSTYNCFDLLFIYNYFQMD